MDMNIHNATPDVGAANDLVWMTVELPTADGLKHSVTLFFPNPAAAMAVGEALMREGHRANEIAKLKASDMTPGPRLVTAPTGV